MAAGYIDWLTTGLTGLGDLIWGNSQEAEPSSQTLEEVFTQNILDLSEYSLSEEGDKNYLANCIHALDKDLAQFDFTSPQTLQEPLREILNAFDYIVERSVYDSEAKRLKSEFRQDCAELIKEKWSAALAQGFYSILLLSKTEEWVKAVQEKTEQFVIGGSSLQQLANDLSLPRDRFSFDLLRASNLNAFEVHYNQTIHQKSENMIKTKEHNLRLPQNIDYLEAKEKAKEDPRSLSPQEMETLECLYPQNSACLEAKKTILDNCLVLGCSIDPNTSLRSEESRLAFEQQFAEFDRFMAKHLCEVGDL